MSRRWIYLLALVAIAAVAAFFITAPNTLTAADLPDHTPDEDNGATMFWAGGCASCHAAPDAREVSDKMLLGGGLKLETPFGTFVAPNISPDPEVGIGGWSTLDFVNAMARGVSPDGSHYYPSFPYTSYQRMTREDLIDLKAFLDTLTPVTNAPPGHDLAFPFNIRRGIGAWKLIAMDGRVFEPDTSATDQINRGAYLTNGPGHCAECHTPRSLLGLLDTPLGSLDHDRWLAGAPNPEGKGFIPNITPHETGLGSWSASDIAYSLETGFTPEFDSLGGQMASVVTNMSQLTAEDREAIAAYLKSVPGLPTPERPASE